MSKQSNMTRALENHKLREEKYAEEIKQCSDATEVYDGRTFANPNIQMRYEETSVCIYKDDICRYLYTNIDQLSGKTAVLNFASYNNPGGGYLKGMIAQEEALCHCTNLYEVLSRQHSYYDYNNNNKNRGIYHNRLLYSPDVLYLGFDNEILGRVDVITCAAPNKSCGIKYGSFDLVECDMGFNKRILFLFKVAAHKHVDNLVLGAWGCGVFMNNPEFVAKKLYEAHALYNGCFQNVIYVIPAGENYSTFIRVGAEM